MIIKNESGVSASSDVNGRASCNIKYKYIAPHIIDTPNIAKHSKPFFSHSFNSLFFILDNTYYPLSLKYITTSITFLIYDFSLLKQR